EAGFYWATRSGVSIAISDVVAPEEKATILQSYEEQAAKVQSQFDTGLITDDERRQDLIEIWTAATNEVDEAMQRHSQKVTRFTEWLLLVVVVTGCRFARWVECAVWLLTRTVRLFLARLSRTIVRDSRLLSTSFRLMVLVRVLP